MFLVQFKPKKLCALLLTLLIALQPMVQAQGLPLPASTLNTSIESLSLPSQLEKYGSFQIFTSSSQPKNLSHLLRDSKQKVLVYIQDAHGNLSAQQNTARILKTMVSSLSIREPWIGVEGTASGEIDHRSLSLFPDPKVRKLAAQFFLKSGELDGAEYYTATANPRARIFGVDSPKLCAQNKRHYKNFQAHAENYKAALLKIDSSLGTLKQKIYHASLFELDRLFEKDEAFAKDLQSLVQITKAKNISLENYPAVQQLTSLAPANHPDELLLAQDKLVETLGQEVEALQNAVWEASFLNPEQKELYTASQRWRTLKKLFEFQASPHDIAFLTKASLHKSLNPIQSLLGKYPYLLGTKQSRPTAKDFSTLAKAFQESLLFYQSAHARDPVLVKNIENLIQRNPQPVSFFIGGGFHQESLVQKLLNNPIAVVVISPKITNRAGSEIYWNRLSGKMADWPLPQLLEQQLSAGPAAATLKLPSSFPLMGTENASAFRWKTALILYVLSRLSIRSDSTRPWAAYQIALHQAGIQSPLEQIPTAVHSTSPGWYNYQGPNNQGIGIYAAAPRTQAPAALDLQAWHRSQSILLSPEIQLSVYQGPAVARSEMRSDEDHTLIGQVHTEQILIQKQTDRETAETTMAGFLNQLAKALSQRSEEGSKFTLKKAPLKLAFSKIFLSVPREQRPAVYEKFQERYAGVTLETNPTFDELLAYADHAVEGDGAKRIPTLRIAPHILQRDLSAEAAASSVALEVLTALLIFHHMVLPILTELKMTAKAQDFHTIVANIFKKPTDIDGVTQTQFIQDLTALGSPREGENHQDTTFAALMSIVLHFTEPASLERPMAELVPLAPTIDRPVPMPDGSRLDSAHAAAPADNSAAAAPLTDYETALAEAFGTPAPQSTAAPKESPYTILNGTVTIAQNAIITLNGVKYKLIRPLGKGGFGEVWRVQKEGPIAAFYALKVVKPSQISQTASPEFIRAARRAALEVSSMVRLQEVAGTPKFYSQTGLVDEQNQPVRGVLTGAAEGLLLMTLAQGKTLNNAVKDLQKQGFYLSPKDAAVIIHNVAKTIAHAHTEGIIHRDLKPDNVMLRYSRQGHDWQHHILDWGLARDQRSRRDLDAELGISTNELPADERPYLDTLTRAGHILGTPGYIGWNQAHSPHAVTYLDDLFALGGTFYAMMTGREIYRIGDNPPGTIARITRPLQGRYQNPGTHNPDIEGTPLEYVLLKMLAPPSARDRHDKQQVIRVDARGNELLAYPSDDAILADLNALVEGQHLPSANKAGLTGYPDAYTVRVLDSDEKTVYDDFIPPADMLEAPTGSTADSGSAKSGQSATSQAGTASKSAKSRSRSTTRSINELLSRVPRQALTQSFGGSPTLPLIEALEAQQVKLRTLLGLWFKKHVWQTFLVATMLIGGGLAVFFLRPTPPPLIQVSNRQPITLGFEADGADIKFTVNGKAFKQYIKVTHEELPVGTTKDLKVSLRPAGQKLHTVEVSMTRNLPPLPDITGVHTEYFTDNREFAEVDLTVDGKPVKIHQKLTGIDKDGTYQVAITANGQLDGRKWTTVPVRVDTAPFHWPANWYTLIQGFHEVRNPFKVDGQSIQNQIHPLTWLQEKGYIPPKDDVSFLSVYNQATHEADEKGDKKPKFPFFSRNASHTSKNSYTVSWMAVDKPISVSEGDHFELSLETRIMPKRTDLKDEELKALGFDTGTYRGSGNILFGLHNPDTQTVGANGQTSYGEMMLVEAAGMNGNLQTAPLFFTPAVPFDLKGGDGNEVRQAYQRAKKNLPTAMAVGGWQTIELVKPSKGQPYTAPGQPSVPAKTYDGKTGLILINGIPVHEFSFPLSSSVRPVLYSSGDPGGAAFGNLKVTLTRKARSEVRRNTSLPSLRAVSPPLQPLVQQALNPQSSAVLFLPLALMAAVTGKQILPLPNSHLVFVAEPGLSGADFRKYSASLRLAGATLIRSPRPFTEALARPEERLTLRDRAARTLGIQIKNMGTPVFFNAQAPKQTPTAKRRISPNLAADTSFIFRVDPVRLKKDAAYRTAYLITAAALSKRTLQLLEALTPYADGSLALPTSLLQSFQNSWQAIQTLASSA